MILRLRSHVCRYVVGSLGRMQRAYAWRSDGCIPDPDIIFLAGISALLVMLVINLITARIIYRVPTNDQLAISLKICHSHQTSPARIPYNASLYRFPPNL